MGFCIHFGERVSRVDMVSVEIDYPPERGNPNCVGGCRILGIFDASKEAVLSSKILNLLSSYLTLYLKTYNMSTTARNCKEPLAQQTWSSVKRAAQQAFRRMSKGGYGRRMSVAAHEYWRGCPRSLSLEYSPHYFFRCLTHKFLTPRQTACRMPHECACRLTYCHGEGCRCRAFP